MTALQPLVDAEERRLGPAYGLWALLGVLGAHRIYCRRPLGFLQGGMTVAGAVLVYLGGYWFFDLSMPAEVAYAVGWPGVVMLVVAVLWALVDAFWIPKWVHG